MTKKLTLLDDVPAGTTEPAAVAFNHQLYAELIRDVLIDNRPGICIGFFARWGQGKSTVINLLRSITGKQMRVVVFNAYQARGDSVRRQMLLSVLKQIDSKRSQEFERFTQVVTPLELQTAEVQNRYEGRQLVQLLMKTKGDNLLLGAGIGLALSIVLLFYSVGRVLFTTDVFADKEQAIITWLGLGFVSFSTYITRWIQQQKDRVLAYTQPVSDSQRLKYPEQFSRVFREAVESFNKETGQRLILVIDDLDRCDPSTVVEALASVRHFCHGEFPSPFDCQFLMPCDEKQMLSALEADGYRYHDYSGTEMLRKFFDAMIRMDEIVPESLADYASVQAKIIGVDAALARDMIDAAGIREPRKVKSLLNAYRLARETVARSQAGDMLPPDSELERLQHSLAAIVCLQELAPNSFATIRDDPDLLKDADWNSDNEPIARRILNGLGPVSAATVDVLITKQYEPSLRGLTSAHALTNAVRKGQLEVVADCIVGAAPADRQRMLSWITQKLRDARSSARIRELVQYQCEVGKRLDWKVNEVSSFTEALRRKRPLLQEALRLGERLGAFAELAESATPEQRFAIDGAILKNYEGGPDVNPYEEQFLLYSSHLLVGDMGAVFRRALDRSVFENGSINPNRLQRLADTISKLKPDAAFGFAPDLGERLLNRLPQGQIPQPQHIAALTIGIRLIGNDQSVRNRLFKNIFLSTIQPQRITDSLYLNHGVYFQLLREVLKSKDAPEGFLEFFRSQYPAWLNNQRETLGRKRVIEFVQPSWKFLSNTDFSTPANVLAQWIWGDEAFAESISDLVDEPVDPSPNWTRGRDAFRTAIFQSFAESIRGHGGLSSGARKFVAKVVDAKWAVSEIAEQILSDKVRRLATGEGGRPDNPDDWRVTFTPLCGSSQKMLHKAVIDALETNARIPDVVSFGLSQFWQTEISSDACTSLAHAILRDPNGLFANTQLGQQLMGKRGFASVALVLFKQLPSQGAQWMYNHQVFVRALSNWSVSGDKSSSRQFQSSVVETLLTGPMSQFHTLGLELLMGYSGVTEDIHKILSQLAARESVDANTRSRAKDLNKLPILLP